MSPTRTVALGVIAVALVAPLVGARQQPPGQTPTFGSRIALVPVDVRVLDRNRRPVTNLGPADFTVLEDGVVQQIQHFSAQTFQAGAPDPQPGLTRRAPQPIGFVPQSQRIFLLLMGRGRLHEPSKGVEAMLRFVRQRLLPQDRVALMAWNRATDFTTDHEKVAEVIERFGRRHEGIDHALRMQFSGLSAVYGGKQIPRQVQIDIDTVFGVPGLPGTRQVAPSTPTDNDRIADDSRRAADALRRAEEVRDRAAFARSAGQVDLAASDLLAGELIGGSFDEYVSQNAQSTQDLAALYTAIDYLRRIDGEKHLVFVTESGVYLPRLENEEGLAAFANDARVAIHTIQTGGVPPANLSRNPSSFTPLFSVRMLRTVAELTGGQSSIYDYAETAATRINQATRFQYLLGYYPSNATWDGRYREIAVKVTRPDVTVLYRHGYYGRQGPLLVDQQDIMATSRIAAAATFGDEIRDIRLQAKISVQKGAANARDVVVQMTIDATRLAFARVAGRRVGSLDVAIFCVGDNGEMTGELWEKIRLDPSDETFERLLKEGVPYAARVPVRSLPQYIKVIVYNYGADLLGSVIRKQQ